MPRRTSKLNVHGANASSGAGNHQIVDSSFSQNTDLRVVTGLSAVAATARDVGLSLLSEDIRSAGTKIVGPPIAYAAKRLKRD